jgi:hypothetical protein
VDMADAADYHIGLAMVVCVQPGGGPEYTASCSPGDNGDAAGLRCDTGSGDRAQFNLFEVR